MRWLFLLLFVIACSSSVRYPTLVIVETRTYNGQTARGEASVIAAGSPHTRLAAARAWLAIAEKLSSTSADAYQAAVRGASELGPDYAARGVREETHVKELAATYEFDAGNDQRAADLMLRVLRSRIAMYQHRYAAEVR